jgi:hypothetical protein
MLYNEKASPRMADFAEDPTGGKRFSNGGRFTGVVLARYMG